MSTYLTTWNPHKSDWTDLLNCIEQTNRGTQYLKAWSIVSHRQISPGDQVYMMRLGEEPKGVMASGIVVSWPFLDKHWTEDKEVYKVDIDFDTILNPDNENILLLSQLHSDVSTSFNWTPEGSGVSIPDPVADKLEEVWYQHLNSLPLPADGPTVPDSFIEGGSKTVVSSRYERNPAAREACIHHYGHNCAVCGLNFEETYGDIGKGFIHVHHINPEALRSGPYQVDPINDLRPVCPNCHAMLHRKKETPYTIDELKKHLT